MMPELFRGNTGILFEYFGKVTLVFKACGNSNINQAVIGIGKEPFAFFNPHHIQILFEGGSDGLFKYGREIGRV